MVATGRTDGSGGAGVSATMGTNSGGTGSVDGGNEITGSGATTASDGGVDGTLDDGGSLGSSDDGSTGDLPPADCDNLRPLPITYQLLAGPTASEDFVFDNAGNLVNIADGGNLLRAPYGGNSSLVFPGVSSGDASGTAMLSNGDVVFADSGANRVIRVDSAGSTEVLASGVAYPNGVTVDMDDHVFVSEHDGGRVLRIEPETLSVETVADGIVNPNGLAFDRDYANLYIGSFGGATVHRLNIATEELELYAEDVEGGELDGVIVDDCDNVYVTDFANIRIYRVKGDESELVVDLSSETYWIPNFHFGSGIGGWDESLLYVIDRDASQLYVLDLGVKGISLPHL